MGKLILLVSFLRQSVTILEEFASHETTYTDKLFNPFKYYVKGIESVFKTKESD